MLWLLGSAIVILALAAAYFVWRNWIAPWNPVSELVNRVGRGEQPSSFLIEGSRTAKQVAVGLEQILRRQRALDRQLAEIASGNSAIFSAIRDALLVLDSERRVLRVNRAFEQWFGIPSNSSGQPLLETVRDPQVRGVVEETFQAREARQGAVTLGNRHVQVSAVPMASENGAITGAVVLFHDVTELKRLDEMRRDFVANVSHELRTPLSILRGYIETLLDTRPVSQHELRRILGVMERHSKRLGLLLDDLLSLAKLESAHPHLAFSSVKLDDLCLNVARDWEKKMAEKNLRVVVDLAAGSAPVEADPARLQEVLYNLLDNAVKYSREGGEIRLRTEQRNDFVALSVTDEGVGISGEDLPRIFERFYRADKSRTGSDGTGLGLAIVKHIAQLHHGRVEAESAPGKGTTIRVILPAAHRAVTQS